MIKAISITVGVLLVSVMMALITNHVSQARCVTISERLCSFAHCPPLCPLDR